MSYVKETISKKKRRDPNTLTPRDLFRFPDLTLLCAPKIEGQYYERKSTGNPARIAPEICAFANSNPEGGLLAVGLSDDGAIDGLDRRGDVSINKLLTFPHYAGARTERKFVDCVNKNGEKDRILLIYVPFLENRVAETSNGKAYVREGDQTRVISYEERRQLEYEKGQRSFEDELGCPYDERLLNTDILAELCKAIIAKDGASSDTATDQLLLSRHFLAEHEGTMYLTNSGLLLLAKDPTVRLPGAYVRFVRYDGTDKKPGTSHNVVKDESFRGPVPLVIRRIVDFVRTQLREFTMMDSDGKFVPEPEYPEGAWLEAVVNALAHRSYDQLNRPVTVEMYDDRLQVTSPGGYPFGVRPSSFIHNPRNPRLMIGLCYLAYVRMLQEGTLRMRREMLNANLPGPEYSKLGEPFVRVSLFNDIGRRLKQSPGTVSQTTEFANLFQIRWTESQSGGALEIDGGPPDKAEVKDAFLKGLQAHGYTVDSFFGDEAIDPRADQTPDTIRRSGLAVISAGFRFRIENLHGSLYLVLDHTISVRNRATLTKVLEIAPEMRARWFRRGFFRRDERWIPCVIKRIAERSQVHVQVWGKEDTFETVSADQVIPRMPSTWIAEVLQRAGVEVDLHRTVKQLALSVSSNASRERSRETTKLAERLADRVFPLRIGDYTLKLDSTPRRLQPPGLSLRDDLSDPEPVFSPSSEGRARTIVDGLSTYGSYEKPHRELPLLVVCTEDTKVKMRQLVEGLRQGSARFRGLETTFGLSIGEPQVETVHSPEEYVEKCQELCGSVSADAFFLVYCPERGYSRADHLSPYFRVKHLLLQLGFPSQMVDENTVNDPRWKDYNLALDIFAKAGHVPWVLSQGLPDADLFLGLSYSSIPQDRGLARLLGYVNVFDRYGKWLFYRGNVKPIRFDERDKVFGDLAASVASDYKKRGRLERLHIHHGFALKQTARESIAEGVQHVVPGAEVSFVRVNKHSMLRLYDGRGDGDGSLPRGKYVITAPNRFWIATTGRNDLGQKGMGTPRPLEVTVNRIHSKGDLDVRPYAQHMLSLTRLNWASVKDFCREPITIKFASNIAYLMNVFLLSHDGFTLHPRLERTPWFL